MLRLMATVFTAITLAGCMATRSELGALRANAESLGAKMLRPAARVRVCRSSILGIPLDGTSQSSLVADILGLDKEADVLTHAEVRTDSITTGVYNRTCVELVGDLGREISVVRLPVVGEHEHHH
jgi:hypothetical protein